MIFSVKYHPFLQRQILLQTPTFHYHRRTLIVLSKDFIKSMWSTMEFQAAHNQALKDKTQVGRQGMMLQLHISVIDHS